MWKAFAELEAIGWLGAKKPRMVAVQATGCAPIVKAWKEGTEHAELWEGAHTIAAGIRVPIAVGDFLILEAIRDSNGFAIAVEDSTIEEAQIRAARQDGLLMSPEGAATLAAYLQALQSGVVDRSERALLFNCGNGLKYPMPPTERRIDHTRPLDFEDLSNRAEG
jgi:threonine synthase